MSFSKGHLTEFTLTASKSFGSAPTVTNSLPRLRVFGDMSPVNGTIKANNRYITYLAKSLNVSPTIDPTTGELLYDLSLMVYDKNCTITCLSVTKFDTFSVTYLELFQSIPLIIGNAKLNTYNLPGYELNENFLFAEVNDSKALVHNFRINDNYSFIVYKNNLKTDLSNVKIYANEEFAQEGYNPIKLSSIFKVPEQDSWLLYWVFGSVIIVVIIVVCMIFIVMCLKKKKKENLYVPRDNMEKILMD